jgi:hypothetical protein
MTRIGVRLVDNDIVFSIKRYLLLFDRASYYEI